MKSTNVFGKHILGINWVILSWVSYEIGNDFEILKLCGYLEIHSTLVGFYLFLIISTSQFDPYLITLCAFLRSCYHRYCPEESYPDISPLFPCAY